LVTRWPGRLLHVAQTVGKRSNEAPLGLAFPWFAPLRLILIVHPLSRLPVLRYCCALLTTGLLLTGCTSSPDDFTPKPKGYNRIDLPPHAYQQLGARHPYRFEYSKHARILRDSSYLAQPHWINVNYPALKANVQITYTNIQNNPKLFNKMLEDARKLTGKHQIKASAIEENTLKTPDGRKVAVFELSGDVPSQFQFYTTDSTKHFFRGALYFPTAVANDSLAPVIDYVKQDIVHLVNTLRYQ
jgi:gliding motility-associated lipoprotein GldD